MKLHQHFLRLHSRFGQAGEAPVTLDELALTLDCTRRNALNIVTSMAKMGWVRWLPKRGRGQRSVLAFLIEPEEIAASSMLAAISRKEVHQVIDQVKDHARSASLQQSLQGWLLSYFGHHSEVSTDRQIDTLRLPLRQKLHTVDPLYMNLMAESFVSSHVFDGLVRRSHETGDIVPNLAHAWEVDKRRLHWTFYLRKGVMFHNGKLLAAEDVIYSFERLVHASHRMLYSSIFKEIKSVRAIGPSAVTIELGSANELFLPFLCTSRAAVVPKDLGRQSERSFGSRPAGTGPFKAVELNERCCVLEVFPYYHEGRAQLDRVEIIHVPWDLEPGPELEGSPFHIIPGATEGPSWSRLHSAVSIRKFVTCNTKKTGPLHDPALRAAMFACLTDADEGAPAPPEKASSGVGSALNPDAPLVIATIPQYLRDAERIAVRLERFGCPCRVLPVEPEEFKGGIRLESDLIVFSLIRDQDEELRLFDLYQTVAQHMEPLVRAYIEQELHMIRREPSAEARALSFAAVEQKLILENQLHILYENPVQTAFLPSVRGIAFNSQGWIDLRQVWFPPQ